jgi:lipoprotein-anchoring transpeptidase ErfK/SrfK
MDQREKRSPAGLLLLIVSALALTGCATPPRLTIQNAEEEIARAEKIGAERYAPELLEVARDSLNQSLRLVRYEEEKWLLPLRDYTKAFSAAQAASQKAQEATEATLQARQQRRLRLQGALSEARVALQEASRRTQGMPTHRAEHRHVTRGEIALMGAEGLLDDGELDTAEEQINDTKEDVSGILSRAGSYTAQYLRSSEKWSRWARETIEWSAVHRAYAVIVDKNDHTCYLYQSGRLKERYDADLGANWMANKTMQGDRVTPEGKYRIIGKRQKEDGHKVLDLNYPNAEDLRRIAYLKRTGQISRRAGLGGSIQIHSGGGRRTDWTEGCVALANRDMDELFRTVPTGTPVTIVGAWKSPPVAESRF